MLLALRNKALEGKNSRAIDEFHRVLKAYEPQASNDNAAVLVAPADMTPEEWIADQEKKNKHRKRPTLINSPD